MIKGFIEVTSTNINSKFLINIKYIEYIEDNFIILNLTKPDFIKCKETYEEIKQKIKEAVE